MELRRASDDAAGTGAPAAYLLGFVLIGLGFGLGGPALSHLRERAGVDDGAIAVVFATQSIGYILGSLVAGRGLDAGHGHRRLSLALVVTTGAVASIGAADALMEMAAGFALLGAAGGVCDVSGNTLVVWSRPGRAARLLNALHLCFAAGAMAAPVVVNRSIAVFGSVGGVALPMAAVTAVALVSLRGVPTPVRRGGDVSAVINRRDARSRATPVALVAAFFFVYVALEAGFAGWIHSYVEQIGYGGAATATGVTTAFGVGFALGRVLSVALAERVRPGWLAAGSAVAALAVATVFVARPGPGVGLWVVSFALALAVAPQYASMLAFAEARLGLSGAETSAMVAASGFGALVVPWAIGQGFDRLGAGSFPAMIVALAAGALLLAAAAGRAVSRRPSPARTAAGCSP